MRRKHLTFSIVFLVLLCSFVALVAISQQKTIGELVIDMAKARDELYHPGDEERNIPKGVYTVYSDEFDVLQARILAVQTKVKAQRGIKIDSTNPKDNTLKVKQSVGMSEDIREALAAVEKQREVVEDKWLDAYDAWQVYHNAIAGYNSHPHVSPEERLDVPGLYKFVATELYSCAGPCDDIFEIASLAQVSHQAYCSEKHGTSGETGVTYWTCNGNTTCDRSDEHWRLCAGTCGNKYAPKRVHRQGNHYTWVANSPHYKKCSVSGCGEAYYTCEHSSCPKSNTHGGSQPPPTDNTPNCQDCTSHCSSPCSCSNSGTCNGTVVDSTPNCSGCTSHCSSPCSCSDSGTCNGTVTTPPSGSTPSGGSSGNSDTCSACGVERGSSAWIADSLHETVTCGKCGEPFTPCTNSSCSYDMYGGWHSSE